MSNVCVAHRGWSGDAPENTLAAMELALSVPYVEWIELDVQLSQDEVPVVIHDYSLGRTTNGRGEVRETPFEELRKLDAGSWFSPKYAGERVPSLEEVLQLVKGRCKLNIELKTTGSMYPKLAERVFELVRQYDMEQEVVYTSFDIGTLRQMKELAPSSTIGLIIDGKPERQLLNELGSSFLSIGYWKLTPEYAADMIENGIRVMAWTIDDPAHIKQVASMHPDIMICTNFPNRWKDTLDLT